VHPQLPITAAANLLIALVDGRIAEFVRTGFRRRPTEHWQEQWQLIAQSFLVSRDIQV
jgi:TetR/AcrR family transcriptional regulator